MSVLKFPNTKQLKEDLDELLKQHPEYKEFQKKVDDALEKAGTNPENRQAVLVNMMEERKLELINRLKDLKVALLDLKNKLERKGPIQ